MVPSPTPIPHPGPATAGVSQTSLQPIPTEQAMEDAMMRSSLTPELVLGKRTRQVDGSTDGNDTEPDDGPPSTMQPQSLPSISNVAAATLHYVSKKKLRPEQRDEVDAFLLDTVLGRQAKLFACILSLENKIDTFRSAAPPYQLSDELKTNITNYGIAVLLSINVSAYKGDIPRNHVLDILKRYRFDLPAGIEHDYANWEKISTFVGYSLTQTRARVKKLIKDSIKANTNIFSLAQMIVHSTPCRTTIQLCSRVALMHVVHAECNGGKKFWNLTDARLEFIRTRAGSSASKTARAFNEILKIDRATYGAAEEYVIGDTVPDEWQQRVDDVVAGIDIV
ncbi:unnamed protein product [Cyclocybe aegerita]|uniref:Uncharacterized protein n=1 Tax=Cyclocybe aegerita TaxID=1973307 RepID=A0A8S0WB64_CYCAE|nr:unnamed protein product [Cyclocybe aegerita]